MKKIALTGTFAVFLVLFLPSSSFAAKLIVINHSGKVFEIFYSAYLLGEEFRERFYTEGDDHLPIAYESPLWTSFGHFVVKCAKTSKVTAKYTVPGTWLPWRNFIITIDPNGNAHFSEV